MIAEVTSAAVLGLDCHPVKVQVDISSGLHSFTVVGLPDAAVKEAKDRVNSAVKNSGYKPPTHSGHITVNLAPADLKKEGPAFDLPIALGYLLSSKQVHIESEGKLFVGELGLDGELQHTKGILPLALSAAKLGLKELYVPLINAQEAALAKKLRVYGVSSLSSLVNHFLGKKQLTPATPELIKPELYSETEVDLADIRGQEHVKRALEIAAAGSHNLLMSGPPGSGKTLLARALPGILPSLTTNETVETTKIYSVAGLLPHHQPLITTRPFRAPHHTASGVALVGGGSWPRPGEVSLAHRGVLFLDEFPEFPKAVLENLRQPLEDGTVTISRAQGSVSFPARFSLIAAMNPCQCGYANDPTKECVCTPLQITKYQKKISGPLLDRIDLHIEVPRVKIDDLTSSSGGGERSQEVRNRVQRASERQKARFREKSNIQTNSEMSSWDVKIFCPLNKECVALLRTAVQQLHLSARSYFRLIKIARTIADIADAESIKTQHVAEAIQYRPRIE